MKKRFLSILLVLALVLVVAVPISAYEIDEPVILILLANCCPPAYGEMEEEFEPFGFLQCGCWCGNGWCCGDASRCSHCAPPAAPCRCEVRMVNIGGAWQVIGSYQCSNCCGGWICEAL